MKQTRTKGKNFMKVFAICALSIGLFCLAFVGFNQMIFASAINEPTALPPTAATEVLAVDYEQLAAAEDAFIAPTFTLIGIVDYSDYSISSSAISMEDAAMEGARYIWDVFGASIDRWYMEIWFSAHASQSNTTWTGLVYRESPRNTTRNEVDGYTVYESSVAPAFIFSIDSITGERIDISYLCQPNMGGEHGIRRSGEMANDYADYRPDTRTPLLEAGWFDMSIDEQVAFAGISDEVLEAYTQTAMTLAQAQFNTSSVSDVQLTDIATNGLVDGVVEVAAFTFTAVDSTGKEARIFIPATGADFRMTSIITSHNYFIPGFNFENSGGIG